MPGSLIAFEGLDQSGKQTQAETLFDAFTAAGQACQLLSFPDYDTAIGSELHRALHGERDYAADVMQLLYVANRYEMKEKISGWLAEGRVILCDRYVASSIAYGEAQGLDAGWLTDIQRFLPPPDLTILLDISPDVAVRRKAAGRDRYERDVALLTRVRGSYLAQATDPRWLLVAGDRPKDDVQADVRQGVASRLGLLSAPAPRQPRP
jgi:dTMP kinase